MEATKYKSLMKLISIFGTSFTYVGISLYMYMIGNKILFYQLNIGLIACFLTTALIRSLYYKDRPNKQSYRTFIGKLDSSSFPSMHSMRVTILFILVCYHYKNIFLILPFLFLCIMVYYSRYYLKKHYWIDIWGGLFIGFIISLMIIN